MLELLSQLRHKCAIGFVGGSDLGKQQEQIGTASIDVTSLFDFCFSENGLTAIRLGKPLSNNSFINWLGEERYQNVIDFCLAYIASVRLPKKRGTFVEYRTGMVNISPVGRSASVEERNEFEAYASFPSTKVGSGEAKLTGTCRYDKEHNIRKNLVDALKKEFPSYGLT